MDKPYIVPLMSVLIGLNSKYQKLYCFPSLVKIQQLLIEFHGIHRSTRSLIRWFGVLEDEGLVRRKKRTRRDPDIGMVFQSTLSFVTKKGYRMMNRIGVPVWNILKKISNGLKYKRPREVLPDLTPVPASEKISLKEMRAVRDKKKVRLLPT